MVSLKRSCFSVYHCVFFPCCCANIGREVKPVLPNTYQEIYDTHASLNFEKHIKMCVYIKQIKSQCKLIILWRSTCSKKSWLGGHFFQNSGSQGPGCVSPGGSSRAVPSSCFFMMFWVLMGFNCLVKVPHKSQCNNYGIW